MTPGSARESRRDARLSPAAGKTILYLCASSSYFLQHHCHLAETAAKFMRVRLALGFDNAESVTELRRRGFEPWELRLTRNTANPLRVFREARGVRAMLGEIRPDLINAITLKSILVSALACAGKPGVRLVGTVPGLGYMFSGNSPKRRLLRQLTTGAFRFLLPRIPHRLVFSNADDLEEFRRRGLAAGERGRIVQVPGVSLAEFRQTPEPREGFRIVLPARMLREKGIKEFVEAAAIVKRRGVSGTFVLAGLPDSGNPSGIREEQLRAWVGEGLVEWLGFCSDMPALFAGCNAVCLPSYYREGFPRVLAEAMSCGRAIITTDSPGCRDAIGNHGTGLLVPPRDAAALAGAILRLRDNPAERMAMGANGRLLAEERFSRDAINWKMFEVYEEVLDDKPTSTCLSPSPNSP